jgi:hypothetical protein
MTMASSRPPVPAPNVLRDQMLPNTLSGTPTEPVRVRRSTLPSRAVVALVIGLAAIVIYAIVRL